MIRVSIIFTCYNEASYLESSFISLKNQLKTELWEKEFIIVDDKSSDSTRSVIEKLIKQNADLRIIPIFHEVNQGRGASVADGIRAASGEFVGFLDTDLEIDAHYIIPAINQLINGADFVMARRIYPFSLLGINRMFISRSYNLLVRLLLKLPFSDTEAGFKFFRSKRIFPVLSKVRDGYWFWDTEIVAWAYKAGLKIVVLPTTFIRRRDKLSTVQLFRDSWNYLRSLLAFRKRYFADKL